MLQIEGLSLSFGRRPVLQGLSLHVAAGETVAVLGPSGEGKSTLLAVLAGLLRPQAGHIRLAGLSLDNVPPEQRQVAMMFQDHALFPHLDAAANVAFGLEMRGMARRPARAAAEAMLAGVGLAGRGAAHCHQLSGGEQQRVALARALVCQPKLFLLDEPFSSLDTHLKRQLLLDVRQQLQQLAVPALLVTHDRDEAFALADRIAILQQGRIVQQGTPAEVLARPANAWVARFVGFDNVYDDAAIPQHAFVLDGAATPRPVLAVTVQTDGWLVQVQGEQGRVWHIRLGVRELSGLTLPQPGGLLSVDVRADAVLHWAPTAATMAA